LPKRSNPPETGLTEEAVKRVRNGKLYLIPASEETTGHLTTVNAKHYKRELQEFLQVAMTRSCPEGELGRSVVPALQNCLITNEPARSLSPP